MGSQQDIKMKTVLAALQAVFFVVSSGKSIQPLNVEMLSEGVACYSNADCLSSEICDKAKGNDHGTCLFQGEPSDADLQAEMGAQVLTAAGLNVSSLTINAGAGKESKIVLGEGASTFTLAIDGDGNFVIRYGSKTTFSVDKNGNIQANGKLHTKGALRVDGQLQYMGLSQFFLAAAEDFNKGATGWTNGTTSVCGSSKAMLGGYGKFSGGEVSKTFRKLAAHKELRLKCNYHFIDAWEGETAYAKVDHMYVWTDSYDHNTAKAGINVCGAPAAEAKFAVPIDVVIPHNATSVTVTFGATLDQSPFEQSWGVDDIMIFLR